MRKITPIILLGLCLATIVTATAVFSQDCRTPGKTRAERFRHSGKIANEGPAGFHGANRGTGQEAPTGYDSLTNGFLRQGPAYEKINEKNLVPLRSFNESRFVFEQVEGIAEGLGPTYNAQSCAACHQSVATGGASQIAEHRTGRVVDGQFFESLGGSLIQSRATYPEIVERVSPDDDVRSFRMSTNTLGDGFVECIGNSTIQSIRDGQPVAMRGDAPLVPVLEGDGTARLGRFGWKNQHASLESFSADAYLNEMGITSLLFPEENTSSGTYVGYGTEYDPVADPEDTGVDVLAFANFMRSTKAPNRGEITGDVLAGEQLFNQVGCAVCHVPSIQTAAPGTKINGNSLTVPAALGNKIIHPYSDFLLHNIGTGDGIPILPQPEYASTAPQIRTAPLWGLRTRNRLMHDGLSFTRQEAIQRHAGQASGATDAFNALTSVEQNQVIVFLDSL
ncbi:MAG: di-heme oxidoredictase family protein [Spartobacteria bacterium]